MNKDIRVAISFFNHPKTILLRRRCGPDAVLSVLQLWCYCAANKPKGDLSGMSDDAIEVAAGWSGERGEFIKHITTPDTLFLDKADGKVFVHDWEEHNPWAFGAPERSVKSKIAALEKHGKKKDAEALRRACGLHPKGMRKSKKGNAPSPSPSPSPLPSPLPSPSPKSRSVKTDIPADFGISERVRKWAKEKGHTQLEEHLEAFKRKVAAKGYKYIEWDDAFMEAIRENWAKLSGGINGSGNGQRRSSNAPESFFARDQREKREARAKARALMGIPGGSSGSRSHDDATEPDGGGADPIQGAACEVSEE